MKSEINVLYNFEVPKKIITKHNPLKLSVNEITLGLNEKKEHNTTSSEYSTNIR